jgi:hypothetical protein
MSMELERYSAISLHGGITTIVTQAAGPACIPPLNTRLRPTLRHPTANEDGWSGFEAITDHAIAALAAMVDDHAITAHERERMVLGVWPAANARAASECLDNRMTETNITCQMR